MAELRGSRLAALPATVLVVVALWEIIATRQQAAAVPADDAWASAAAVVRVGHRPGDLIVFAPDWADPIGRLHLGDLIPVEMAARMDAARYGRIWELSIRGAHAKDVTGLVPTEERDVGGVAVRRYDRAPAVVLADVREVLSTARSTGGGPRVELAEVGFEPHRCVVVVPPASKPVRITFPRLALGSELVGYVGIADVFTRRDDREPGTLSVEIAGAVVATVTAGIDAGWVRYQVPTTPGVAEVTFVISSASPRRQMCFAAETRR
ncbi:MAG: hypothetical protein H6Q90_6161 [Deltaproteobacteria bacterium]|nr:hypothetical protein [Deltaproteobacteria bacterium]